jgi:thiol-disulfide isomerase/thioredoxin
MLLTACLWVGAAQVQAAQRVVFFENFTATWCTKCPEVGRALDNLMTDYPDTLLAVQYHVDDDYDNPISDVREDFYNVLPLPTVWMDGVDSQVGYFGGTDQVNYDGFFAMYQDRVDLPTPVMLDISVEEVSGQTYNVTVDVELEAGAAPLRVDVHVLDCLYGYPQASDNRYHNMAMQGFQISGVDLQPGETTSVVQEVTFDATSWANQEDIRIVALAQEGAAGPPAEIYQAGVVAWPFGGTDCPGDLDGDGDVDQSDLGILLASYDVDDGGDLNGDGETNQQDLGILLANYELPC